MTVVEEADIALTWRDTGAQSPVDTTPGQMVVFSMAPSILTVIWTA